MKVLLSTGTMKFTDKQIDNIRNLKDVELLIHKDEREPLTVDIGSIDYLVTFSLLNRYNIDDFKNLKGIQALSAGLNLMPIEKAKARHIPIFSAKDVYSIPIAEFVLMRTLEIYKNARFFESNQKNKVWKKSRGILEINEKTVGIVGFGSIGVETAKRFNAFGAKVIGFSRNDKDSPYLNKHYHTSALSEMISSCDIVVLCLPHTDETHEMFDKALLDQMKIQSVLINIARGQIINENDLIKKIEEKKFLGVALDVTYEEPLQSDSKLWGLDNVYISPHNSYVSDHIEKRLYECVYHNLKHFINDLS